MANKRDFKKYSEALVASICEEMMFVYYNDDNADKDKIAKAIEILLGAAAKAKSNANVFFDKGMKAYADHKEYSKAKKAFFQALFKKIDSELTADIDEALKLFNSSLSKEQKEANKTLA